ncbi:hypothetical protein A5721_22345 [Mycobacterium vulneris]|nr:hypothetical protein A5721_22345 [Mycolicibacterium vulneris]
MRRRMTISPIRRAHLIRRCRDIAAIFDELLPDTAIDANAHRRGGVNPYYNRTTSGLYLEFYYGYPSKIWTPGGYWTMTGSTVTPPDTDPIELVRPFMQRLSAIEYQPLHQDRWGCYGPVYSILAIDGWSVEYPGPVAHWTRFEDIDYAADKADWADLATGWGDRDGA